MSPSVPVAKRVNIEELKDEQVAFSGIRIPAWFEQS